ncbi:tRNA guanosine(34) transglycosylase Tgt [Prochlorococcus marinus]|uniref:Queuine tRNA-ribosyltransferase n=1 Tax=Prochlorococcus marinus (strain AS9601) TaxID=146891 RepID=TGT_PROMS|nr:tRNA guanosine(34) transglycosylase Tgt [Prochlorococcus marinus]A2BP70.1 RecName: Full=Queuine tRNA-ribosyltransferase; AltName: Full=Guanine insertion enzyme; AltName: Full=tRNA-guanine transglycosylase [Prochlorococcus marinus str. AS9601]ABM69581.1 tRNA-guanine transglycosylase [Prochlorococcus marinus str. AS9601]
MFEFEITSNCSNTAARTGIFHTPNGQVNTPKFMPVGTLATVKGISSKQLTSTGSEMILSNTFHLHLQPGEKLVKESGGIHKFMNWPKPILTDSGGYQVFSLAKLNNISDKGVEFKNPRDGSYVFLSPEKVIQIQMDLGSDVAMAFDHCPPHTANENDIEDSLQRTHSWLQKSVETHQKSNQALFGIVQGGKYPKLREYSAKYTSSFDLPGIAVGGVSVGETVEEIHSVINYVPKFLPIKKPRYLMGIGSLKEISLAVANGFDIFDCVLPTRLGRHGTAFFNDERLNLRNARFKNDFSPIDKTCKCETCKSYSRAYLHHLIRNDEILGLTLISLHNIAHLIRFTNAISTAIRDNCFTNDFAPWKTSSIAHHTW